MKFMPFSGSLGLKLSTSLLGPLSIDAAWNDYQRYLQVWLRGYPVFTARTEPPDDSTWKAQAPLAHSTTVQWQFGGSVARRKRCPGCGHDYVYEPSDNQLIPAKDCPECGGRMLSVEE